MRNQKFVIMPHFRLHEWVAEEKGYFRDEGLDYEFQETVQSTDGKVARAGRQGRRDADDREGPHLGHQLRLPLDRQRRGREGTRQALSATSIRCRRPACSCRRIRKIKTPEDLAGVPISVGYQSGSHYATIQALEQYMPLDKINLSFKDGMLFSRMELLFEGKIPACTLFSGPYYFAEQLGFRKVIDCTFMITTMITGDPDPEDVRKFFRALRRAQRDIDLRPELYTHYYKNEFPKRFHAMMDTRRWGPGERIVFESYSREVFEELRDWIRERGIFEDNDLGAKPYESAVVSLAV